MVSAYPLVHILWISFFVNHALTAGHVGETKKQHSVHSQITKTAPAGDEPSSLGSGLRNQNENGLSSTKPKPLTTISTFHNKKVSIASILTISSSDGTKIFAEVTNNEDSAAAYTVHLSDCSDELPVKNIELEPAIQARLMRISNFTAKISEVYLIPPRRAQVFIINLIFPNSVNKFQGKASCLVNVLNRLNGRLAAKLIDFSAGDSCVCSTNCACSCHSDDGNLICNEISDSQVVSDWLKQRSRDKGGSQKIPPWDEDIDYPDDGAGKLETSSSKGWLAGAKEKMRLFSLSSIKSLDDKHLLYLNLLLLFIVILVFLILGTCKGLWGICCYAIGRCGLSYFYDKPKTLTKYYEKKYTNYPVIHDSEGYPLDPFTRGRTVKRLNPYTAFFLNVIFFLCCPVFCFYGCCKNKDSGNDNDGHENDNFDLNNYGDDSLGSASRRNQSFHEGESRGRILMDPDQMNDTTSKRSLTNIDSASSFQHLKSAHSMHNVRIPLQGSSNIELEDLEGHEKDEDMNEDNRRDFDGRQSDSLMPYQNQNFVTGYMHVQPDTNRNNGGSSTMMSPLPTSSTILNKLSREPQQWPDPQLLLNERKYSQEKEKECNNRCRPVIPYGSWHRAPAIFNDDYEGDSLFDIHRTLAMTRNRRENELDQHQHQNHHGHANVGGCGK